MSFSVSDLVEKYFWALPDENMQKKILSVVDGLHLIHNLSIILQKNLNGCKYNKGIFKNISPLFLVPLRDAFKDFTLITNKLMRDYGLPLSTIELLRNARLFKDPVVSF